MGKLFINIIVQLSAYASLLGLYLTVIPLSQARPNWHWVIMGCAAVVAILLLIREIKDFLSVRTRRFSTDKGIKNYMCSWISSPGRTVVFSRDLSWGGEPGTKRLLLEKSKKSELTIYLENATALSDELKSAGANIKVYGGTGFVPQSRFTIVGSDKQGARVAVGLFEDGKHAVYQFESGKHPIFALAQDLVNITNKVGI